MDMIKISCVRGEDKLELEFSEEMRRDLLQSFRVIMKWLTYGDGTIDESIPDEGE